MSSRISGIFVTGTDTSAGKTYVGVALVRALVRLGLRVAVMKPVASGSDATPDGLRNSDAIALAQAANVSAPYHIINPYCFIPPISPHIAADEAHISIDLGTIRERCDSLRAGADLIVVEGAGGWYAPISASHTMADIPAALGLPVVLVVGLRLGCLNHALLSKQAIERGSAPYFGWVANSIDPVFERSRENVATLERSLEGTALAALPFGGDSEAATAALADMAQQLRSAI